MDVFILSLKQIIFLFSDTLDFSKLTLHQAKRMEMDSQV